jgi:hypothetical protein
LALRPLRLRRGFLLRDGLKGVGQVWAHGEWVWVWLCEGVQCICIVAEKSTFWDAILDWLSRNFPAS